MTDLHPAPPSAPASEGGAGFEAKIARIRNYHMRGTEADIVNDRPVEVPVCSCGHHPDDCEVRVVLDVLDAAQRQHAAEHRRLMDAMDALSEQHYAALEAAQQEGAKLRYELAFAAPQFHGKGEQMEGRWHCRVCGVFGQGYDTIKHRDTCPLYGYDYTTARSTLAATPPAAPTEAQEPNLRRLCAACGHMTIEHDLHARDAHCQECACPGFRDQPPPAGADALREDG